MAAGISGLTLGGFWGLAPVYASQVGFDAAGVGLLMSITILGGAVLQWPIGLFSDKHDRRVVLLWVVAIAAVLALVITPILSGSAAAGADVSLGRAGVFDLSRSPLRRWSISCTRTKFFRDPAACYWPTASVRRSAQWSPVV
ncbi:MAG: hypothetical protein MZV63_21615 [Marinilabiliales bacterium]|nr:hypothetical protein [Marinilabiliales bacterium]